MATNVKDLPHLRNTGRVSKYDPAIQTLHRGQVAVFKPRNRESLSACQHRVYVSLKALLDVRNKKLSSKLASRIVETDKVAQVEFFLS